MPSDAPNGVLTSPSALDQSSRLSLGLRTVMVTTLVALLAVLMTGLAALPLLRDAELRDQRRQLSQLADAAAASTQTSGPLTDQIQKRLISTLRSEQVSLALITPDGQNPQGLDSAQMHALWDTGRLSATYSLDAQSYMVEGRLIANDTGLLLLQPTSVSGFGLRELWGRIGMAIVIGGVLAAIAGALLARRVTRPLRTLVNAARRLQAGDRHLRLQPEGPAEVAELAVALNQLGDGLASSEARQRDFLLTVSHELRTPMTAIGGYAEALADGVVDEHEVERVAGTMLAETHRLDALIADLLDLARLGAVEFPVDVVEMDLRDVALSADEVWADRCAAEGVKWVLQVPADPVPVRCDPRRARQIIDNLVANALRVTPAGQPIVLQVATDPPAGYLEVRDGGPGLSDSDLAVAFEPAELYSRYRGLRQVGTGVGLALVGRLADRLGGRASAGHAAEGGACFRVCFPGARG
ncbi:MAG TPA: histidine kinase dimerization/phospho-acceptor domain-containing protein [Actinomycetota bacterium]|nr:histidine kinase dimerization/phospho-acceptor domain-containing protein [Actinomycetota bacterium]